MRRFSVVAAVLLLVACSHAERTSNDAGAVDGGRRVASAPAAPAAPAAGGITAKPVKTGLDFPAAFTFSRGGKIFYAERFSGEIRVLVPKTGATHLFFRVPGVVSSGEQGLIGIALHPNFPQTPFVYVYATRNVSGTVKNQILRIRNDKGRGRRMTPIFTSNLSPDAYHDGGRILFGPDDNLYTVIGEAHSQGNAQNLQSTGGKVLRMTDTGGIPPNPPLPGRAYAYGIRNSFGLAFDPRTGRLWESEAGPSCNDEVNRIIPGRNYGWGPTETCDTPPSPPRNTNRDGPNPVLPKRFYNPVITPTGLVFCRSCGLGTRSNGGLFVGAYNTGAIRRLKLTSNRLGVKSQSIVYKHGSGILSMEAAPKGWIYFSDAGGIWRLT